MTASDNKCVRNPIQSESNTESESEYKRRAKGSDGMYLAENIKFLREREGMTQAEFAEVLGDLSQSAVGNWEAGKREPEIAMVVKIAEVFNVSLDDLILHQLTPPTPQYVSNLIYLRKQYDMTQEDIAKLLGYRGKSSISLVEAGKASLSVENLEKLSDYFGVTLDQLVKQDLTKGVEQNGIDGRSARQA